MKKLTQKSKKPLVFLVVFAAISIGVTFAFSHDQSILENLFGIADLTAVFYYSGVARSILLCILTLLFLRAMHHIARDLEVEKVPLKCQTMMVWTLLFYAAYILFDSQLLTVLLPENAVAICYLILIIGSLILPIANLTIIFSCYKWICLPEDLERESKIKFDEPKREEAPQRKGKGKK